ncbi:MAG: UDP-N-acetylglucosamine diphosphorylase [Opitutales bacterium]
MQAGDLFNWPDSLALFREWFNPRTAAVSWVGKIAQALKVVAEEGKSHVPDVPSGLSLSGPVSIHPSVTLPPFGTIEGPTWIGPDCELRAGVYIRGNVIAGRGCVLGNSCEFKNSLLLDEAKIPHFSYVGDSVIGNRVNLGAGTILSNLRFDGRPVRATGPDGPIDTGTRKFGALIGDDAQTGCHAVLQPGVILGRKAVVMGSIPFSGWLDHDHFAYAKPEIHTLRRKRD